MSILDVNSRKVIYVHTSRLTLHPLESILEIVEGEQLLSDESDVPLIAPGKRNINKTEISSKLSKYYLLA